MESKQSKVKALEVQNTELLHVRRTTRITKGGRRYSFQAVLACGDRHGQVNWTRSRGADVSIAIEKAMKKLNKNALKKVPIINGTIPFEIKVKYKSAVLFLQPAKSGGIIAGGVIRKICELAGIKNIKAKIISRTKNKINHIHALFKAFELLEKKLKTKENHADT